ncbi:hypothetical protein ACLVWU_07500 [Bdellovibrio sp. HCB290]|uniref:hypothetical protein n=1 Tax=Bdellovibrio sp. HCB290 TaxID=3394356 RepID=UPI0039B47E3A
MKSIRAFVRVLSLIFFLGCLQAKGSDSDSRPIRANYQKLQLYEQLTRGTFSLPLPLPDEPGDGAPAPEPAPPPAPPKPRPPAKPPYCNPRDPDTARCVRAVCDQMQSYDCSTDSKIKDIACQCDGVNGECVTAVCNQMDRFDCDEKRELFNVTRMCYDVKDASCINRICSQLGRFECDDVNDMRRVTELCR